jgi:hypothetical protein
MASENLGGDQVQLAIVMGVSCPGRVPYSIICNARHTSGGFDVVTAE